jgi:uncharacterized protein
VTESSDVLVMAKPVGPRCNLRCGYCYYLKKQELFADGGHRMDLALTERFVAQRFAASPGPVTHFEWHGGEPTLAGLDWFRTVVRLQKRLCPPGRRWTNGLQTNGVRLDAAWADFLAEEGFTVGLSLDGPARYHDPARPQADGKPTHDRVVRALGLLQDRKVGVNLLCVVHPGNVQDPDGVYDFFRSCGASYLQFLPLVPGAPASEVGVFLCRVFDRWISADVGALVVQTFDEALRPYAGVPHALCVHRPTCGDVVVLEHDGSVYSCDHFVDPDHRLGSLADRTLGDLAAGPRQMAFGLAKQEGLAAACRTCDVLESCHGGCPKDRDETGLNRLCDAYRAFFRHARPGLGALAAHLKTGRPLRSFRYQVL